MNRRNFFSAIAGAICGIYVVFAPSKKSVPPEHVKEFDGCALQELERKKRDLELWLISKGMYPPYVICDDGTTYKMTYKDIPFIKKLKN